MTTPDGVEARLRDAGTRWTTVRGVVRHHRRHDLVTVGFERYFARLEKRGWRIGPAPDDAVAAALADPTETVVLAEPRPGRVGPPVPGSEVFAMITGGDRFRLSVDDDLGVLLRVVKEVNGAVAETVEFTEIAFDVPLADDLFAPIR